MKILLLSYLIYKYKNLTVSSSNLLLSMEQIYLKGYPGPREWCSEKVNFKSYFENYCKTLNRYGPIYNTKLSDIDILQYFVPQSNQLSKEQLEKLIDITK